MLRPREIALAVAVGICAAAVPFAAPAHAAVVLPFAKRYKQSVYGDFITVGNTVVRCPASPPDIAARCANAQAGNGPDNNNQFSMTRGNMASVAGAYDSSSARFTIPAGATVAYARLFWGGNTGEYRSPSGATLNRCDITGSDVVKSPGSPLTARPSIHVGGAAGVPVPPEHAVQDAATLGGPHYYTAEGNVTAAFSRATTGAPLRVVVSDVWAADGQGCVAGWSLTVVYSFPGPDAAAPTRREIDIYGGHVLQRSRDPETTITISDFYRAGTAPVRASVTAHEGDRNAPGDQFLVNGTNIPAPRTGATANFFDSDADGSLDPNHVDNLSIDAKEFDLPAAVIPPGATSARLTFRTRADTYVAQHLALSVPVPDLEVTKKPLQTSVAPGDTLTYQILAKNISPVDYPGAKLNDDLTDLLDDARYAGDAKASVGTVSFASPKLSWTGNVPAGKTATITYSVIINEPRSGDGKLRNNIDVATPRSNCDAGSTDPGCTADITITDRIPVTGGDVLGLLAVGGMLLVAGAMLLVGTRRV